MHTEKYIATIHINKGVGRVHMFTLDMWEMLPYLCDTIQGSGSVESLSNQLWGTHHLQEK